MMDRIIDSGLGIFIVGWLIGLLLGIAIAIAAVATNNLDELEGRCVEVNEYIYCREG